VGAHDRGSKEEVDVRWRERVITIEHDSARRSLGSEFLEKSIPRMRVFLPME